MSNNLTEIQIWVKTNATQPKCIVRIYLPFGNMIIVQDELHTSIWWIQYKVSVILSATVNIRWREFSIIISVAVLWIVWPWNLYLDTKIIGLYATVTEIPSVIYIIIMAAFICTFIEMAEKSCRDGNHTNISILVLTNRNQLKYFAKTTFVC